MGEVLENGVYLPDEGERNAYNGLKGNWNTVDTVVAQVQALSSTGLIRKPVDELPTEDIETNVIYMLKAVKPNGDVYRIEYMYIDGHWDALGTSETTLDDYYTKSETDNLPAVKSGINATRVSNYDAHLANNDIHVTLANKATWDGKQNALDTAQTAAVNSGVTAAKVTGYDTHVSDTDIHVTTSDKTAWNAKQDGLSQTQLAAVNSGITEAKRTGYDSHVADTDAHVTTADKAAWNGKQNALTQAQLDNIAAVPDKANSADLATVATTGDYGDLLNAPAIPTVNNASLTIQKNGTDVATFTANASSNVTANLAIPVNTSDLNNDAGFLTQHNPIDNELSATSENALQNKVVKSELDGKAPLVHTHAASDVTSGTFNIARIPNLDASKITSGTIDIARLPKGSLERLVKVANQAARYALTTDDVQLGDTVQQLDTGVMYVVTDETKLDSADGYTEFTAGAASSVPWTGVTGKPNDYPPSSHTHTKSQITDFPTLATVATSGSYNDLNNIPASFTPSSHTHGNITNDGKVGTTANKPLITGTGGVVQAGSFGNSANTFCEGNDSRLSDARTPVAHTHTKSDITNLFNSANTWTDTNTYTVTGDVPIKITNNKDATNPSATEMKDIRFSDVNGKIIGGVRHSLESGGTSKIHLYSRSFSLDGSSNSNHGLLIINNKQTGIREVQSESNLIPSADNTYNLGSSSNQWKSVYAQNYYYNGTAWGLDKANTWTEANTFSNFITSKESAAISAGGYGKGIAFRDYQNNRLGYIQPYLTSDNAKRLLIGADSGDIASNSNLIPNTNNSVNLGSSSNQWNTLYAKNYFYNGTQWGLDKANTWTALNTYSNGQIRIKSLSQEIGVTPSSGVIQYLEFADKNDVQHGKVGLWDYDNGASEIQLSISDKYNNGVKDPAGTSDTAFLSFGFQYNGTKFLTFSGQVNNSVIPLANNAYDLGSSSYQWNNLYAKKVNTQSVNGINPGALSLPKEEYTDVDISAQGLNWDLTGSSGNSYTPNRDGWLEIWAKRTSLPTAYISVGNTYVRQVSEATVFNFACVTCPVRNGQTYTVRVLANECHVRIIKAEGNV